MAAEEEHPIPVASASFLRGSIYYGWVNVVMGAFAMTATLPGRTHGLGLITKPLLTDLRMDETLFGYLNGAAILLGTLVAWPIAWLVDRWGTRLVGGTVILGLGASVAAMSFVQDAWPLFICLFLVRALGQGALSVAATAMVSKWFSRRLGLAMGVFSMLLGIGFVASTPSFQYAVEQYGWREPWLYLGLVLLCGLGPLTLLLVRSAPTKNESNEFEPALPAAPPAPVELQEGIQAGAPPETGMRAGEPPLADDGGVPPRDATLREASSVPRVSGSTASRRPPSA